ncbi:MAG: hypothetical protein WCS37_03465, partial [Chloroflexota bacterium]
VVKLGQALQKAPGQRLTPEEATLQLERAGVKVGEGGIEPLLARLPGFRINRQSLFEVFVEKG